MSDYDAIYAAVRSRLHGGAIEEAVERAVHALDLRRVVERAVQSLDLTRAVERIEEATRLVLAEHERPSAVFRPKLSVDGDRWCALYGASIHDGLAGFGASAAEAMSDFDLRWNQKETARAVASAQPRTAGGPAR